MDSVIPPLPNLLAALAAGLLVGLERGWSQRGLGEGRRVAGFRTFGLFGLGGGVAGLAPDIIAAALLLGVVVMLAIGFLREADASHVSATNSIAGLLTFTAGFLAVRDSPTVGLSVAAAMFVMLSARQSLHALLKGVDESEIEGIARFVLVALVILPLLPDRAMGPYDAWNPRNIWMVVVFVTGLSFVGYAAVRRLGSDRGLLIVALTGALVSSTAVTADFARRMRSQPEARGALIAGIAVASMVMFLRVQLLTLALAPRALPALALAMAPATIVAGLCALVAWRGQGARDGAVSVANPLAFGPALLLAGLVAILSLVARWSLEQFGDKGLALVLGLTGMSDVDAAVMTLAGLPPEALDAWTAGLVLAVPVLANTAIKAGMAIVIAWGHGGWRAAWPLIAALAASGAGLLLY
ncbi:MgtC/SapB family protein [Rhizorhabdus dicambivorans]|uniref:Uncharacterized protein n=1 Tax=Rhizorhabdus dicambivorans TaxID=1850238 RepID=A0A2A4FUA7_9SPHN|nr:DUF4010 domain-containing protein [Rhizorhabdus dicambivorans]ATE65320.1 hypothetical protein CMV14_13645 [Rhizorhabdus dicambivorans]PCE42352.1 hypothetical protein COO09_10135 [Rhizorhabdus dicambivorans]